LLVEFYNYINDAWIHERQISVVVVVVVVVLVVAVAATARQCNFYFLV